MVSSCARGDLHGILGNFSIEKVVKSWNRTVMGSPSLEMSRKDGDVGTWVNDGLGSAGGIAGLSLRGLFPPE